jgi:hypothetical protein
MRSFHLFFFCFVEEDMRGLRFSRRWEKLRILYSAALPVPGCAELLYTLYCNSVVRSDVSHYFSDRFCGLFPCIWRRLLSYHNWCFCKEQGMSTI